MATEEKIRKKQLLVRKNRILQIIDFYSGNFPALLIFKTAIVFVNSYSALKIFKGLLVSSFFSKLILRKSMCCLLKLPVQDPRYYEIQ
jgi:hypothetical protein